MTKKIALTWDALVCGCWLGPVMLVTTPMTSIHPSSETISKRMSNDARNESKENVVDGDGFAHTRGTGNENAGPPLLLDTTLLSYSLTQSNRPATFPSLHKSVRPLKMFKPQTA